MTILQDFPDEQYAFMLKWIGVLSRNEKVVPSFPLAVSCVPVVVVLGDTAARFNPFTDKEFALRFFCFVLFSLHRTATKEKFSKPELFIQSHLLHTRMHKKSEFKQDVM